MNHDDAEREAMRAFYAEPAARKPYLPTDRDTLRDGLLRASSPDGCCHRTRVRGAACPVGWACPHDVRAA